LELAALPVSYERRLVRFCVPTSTAVVTGADRLSGGGDVLVGPDLLVWTDVVLPAGDPLWVADVSIAPLWLGRVWAAALTDLGVGAAIVHEGPMIRSESRWCFDSVGPGEVLVGGDKIVGISQKRTREGVLFQCATLLRGIAAPDVEAAFLGRVV
jgi:lipoate-protein ligase A